MVFKKVIVTYVIIFTLILISGCSLMCTEPTIWRPNSSPEVMSFWDLKEHGESWKGTTSLGGGGIGGSDSMYNAFIVYLGQEFILNNWIKSGTRFGLLFLDQDITVKIFRSGQYGFVSTLQLHGGYNLLEPSLVGDGSVIIGKILNPYTIGDEVPRPSSILYLGYRMGWLKSYSHDNFLNFLESQKTLDNFSSLFAGLEVWFGRLGIYVSFDRLKPNHPELNLWKDPKNENSYILMTSGLKYLFRK